MIVPAIVKSSTYFLGICKVNIKQSVTLPGTISYGSEPAFPPLWAMTPGIFQAWDLGFYTMNQSSSSTADVHTTEVITTPCCQTSYCSQDHIYCSSKENQHLLANYCTLLSVKCHVPLPIRQECRILWGQTLYSNYGEGVFCHKRYLNFQRKPSCFCYIQEYALYKTHKYYKEDVLNNRIVLQIRKLLQFCLFWLSF